MRAEGLSVCKIQEWHPDDCGDDALLAVAEIHPAPTLKGRTAPPQQTQKNKINTLLIPERN